MTHKPILAAAILWGAMGLQAAANQADMALQSRVTKRLHDANFDSVTVTVSDRIATLTGVVDRLSKSERAQRLARKTEGLSGLRNEIQVRSTTSDEEIAREVARQIRLFPFYDIFDLVDGEVKDGAVTLRGSVRLPQRYHDYANLVKQVSGARSVTNLLEVLPTSSFDDELRIRVARAVYGSAGLGPRYGNQAHPPIHIIVKNGTVRLEGVVLTSLDKQLAGKAARFAATYFALENNLQIAKG